MKKKSENAGALTLEFSTGNAYEIAEKLKLVDGVVKSEASANSKENVIVRVTPLKQADRCEVRRKIYELVKNQGWNLSQMKIEEGRLDEVFYTMTNDRGR